MKYCYKKKVLSQFSNDENLAWEFQKKKSASAKQRWESTNKGEAKESLVQAQPTYLFHCPRAAGC